MAEYAATISWRRNGTVFTDNRYSRGHLWQFDGGVEVPASSSPVARFASEHRPTPEQLQQLHHQAHEQCFIANSVKTRVL